MPTYRVDRPGMDKPRVVEAHSPNGARAHVAKDELTVRKIETREAFDLAATGVKLEKAGDEPPAQQESQEWPLTDQGGEAKNEE